MLEYHALGPVAVVDETGAEVPVGGPRQRRLVAMLLLHRNAVVSADALAEAVFAGEPTPAARTTLRSYVARLRRVVEPDTHSRRTERAGQGNGGGPGTEGAGLVTRAPGYMLVVPDDAFDVARFERLVARGRTQLDHGDPAAATQTLRDALATWRGAPYAEFDGEDWVRPEAERLRELRVVAEELLIDAQLACGATSEVVARVEQLTAEHPLRDGLWARRMLALYRAGRQPDALRAYQEHRQVLADELGLDPSPELAELERRILEHDPSLRPAEPAGRPLRGYRLGERLGIGRQGAVHAARLPGIERDLAIRVYRPDVADAPEFVRRFEADALRVASLRHEAIVPIHDFWREPGAAYLVMRRMAGGTLRDRIARGPLAPGELAGLIARVGGALLAAHAAGVHHGRIGAESILCDDAGAPYLSDFTIGIDPPAGAEPRRDGLDFAALVAACLPQDGPAASTAGIARTVDARLAAVCDLLGRDPPLDELVPALLAALEEEPAPRERVNPYKGLRPFDEPDAADFFGRDRVVRELLDRLARDDPAGRLVLLVGASGSGKSSVVRAGLLPRIRAGTHACLATAMVPGTAPFAELAAALRAVAIADPHADPAALAAALGAGAGGIDREVRKLLPAGTQLLLVIDQFEELFTLTPPDEQRRFLDGVVQAIGARESRLRVVATLRGDFYDRPLQVPGFGPLVRDATVTVPTMSASELEAAVTGPAARAGLEVEPALVVDLVAAVLDEPAALPALQFALFELTARTTNGSLSRAGYEALGGIDAAIANRAEVLYTSLDDDTRSTVRHIFEQLVTIAPDGEPTRRRAALSELGALGGRTAALEIADTWAHARLLTLDRDAHTREPTVEVAHEALLHHWPRLRGWIDDDREVIVTRARLRDAAGGWTELDRDPGALYRGVRLDHALEVLHTYLPNLSHKEQAFLEASRAARDEERRAAADRVARQARENRRLRLLVVATAVGLVIAVVMGLVAIDQRDLAQEERRTAVTRELAAAAVANLDTDPERAVLLALEAVARAPDADPAARRDAEEALHRAVTASRIVLRVPGVGGFVDWSPDGSMFVTEGPEDSGMIDVRDARTGASLRSWRGHDVDVNGVTFSSDGSMLASAGDDGAVRVWDPATGEELFEYVAPERGIAFWPAFSPDGERIAVSWMRGGLVRVLDLDTGAVLMRSEAQLGPWSLEFSPDGRSLAVGSAAEGPAVVLDARTGEERYRVGAGHASPAWAARWSPDGRFLATSSGDGTARIWDARDGRLRFTLTGHSGAVAGLDWSPDSRRLVTGSEDGTARVWEIGEGGAVPVLTLSAWDTRNGVIGVAFSADGGQVMAGDIDVSAVQVWDVTPEGSAEWANLRAVVGSPNVAAYTGDGRRLLTSGRRGVVVWDAARHQRQAVVGGSRSASSFAVSPDGRLVAVGNWDSPAAVWDLETGARRFTAANSNTDDLAWSRDGSLLAVNEGWRVVIVGRSGEQRAELLGDDDAVLTSVDFDATGARVVTAQTWSDRADFTIPELRVWDWERGEVVRTIDTLALRAVWSPDGSLIAATNHRRGLAEVFDAASGERLATLSGHTGAVEDIAFSPDATTVATGGSDATVRLWDARTGEQLLVLRGHDATVTGVAFSPDGRRLVSAAADGQVRVWALAVEDLVEIAHENVTRTLTDHECRQYLHVDACSDA